MSQYQPPQGGPTPQPSPFPQQQAPQGFGQGSQAPQGFGQQSQPQFGQQSQAQFGQPGFPQQGFQQPPAEPGLFDTSFARPTTPKVAKTAYISVIVLAGTLVLYGLFSAISSFSTAASMSDYPGGGGASFVLAGIGQLLLLPALGFAILTLGRLAIEYFVQTHKAREAAATAGSSEKA
ncbi:DUF4282 domain-containing protein [Pseudactinotalea suaedae]|uniref:DUF4282 domain-containing protein n=1 Tax=Pseudactinotalea suaedae TaxID=1524924 RepID=UPI0012E15CB9|nr:DUF4282 domain-containing protein [Pseudactinotalea suaedae]